MTLQQEEEQPRHEQRYEISSSVTDLKITHHNWLITVIFC